jgi:hypothetical protein
MDEVSPENWVDPFCNYYDNLTIKSNVLANNRDGWVYIFGRMVLKNQSHFSIKVNNIK